MMLRVAPAADRRLGAFLWDIQTSPQRRTCCADPRPLHIRTQTCTLCRGCGVGAVLGGGEKSEETEMAHRTAEFLVLEGRFLVADVTVRKGSSMAADPYR